VYEFVEFRYVRWSLANDGGHKFKVEVLVHQSQLRCCCFFGDIIPDSIMTWKSTLYRADRMECAERNNSSIFHCDKAAHVRGVEVIISSFRLWPCCLFYALDKKAGDLQIAKRNNRATDNQFASTSTSVHTHDNTDMRDENNGF
jgi:hypothetical protein